ncbi:hypothetical protein RISK_004601 [Rhodopirellula islandica]|uniref:Uncharacterized protein n=1 Tax=Rhodopirellula islandica TaxID=595434 RepID=A0A0J1ECI7_RHOIS|nr:hypothetical protein RISK_004601 [Rhodopirellula islandica]
MRRCSAFECDETEQLGTIVLLWSPTETSTNSQQGPPHDRLFENDRIL